MNGAYSAEEVYTESDIQYIIHYAGSVRVSHCDNRSCSYGRVAERHRCSYRQCLLHDFEKANFMVSLGNRHTWPHCRHWGQLPGICCLLWRYSMAAIFR